MSSDQIDPADLTRAQEHGPSDREVVERLQRLWSAPQDKSPSPFLQTQLEHIDRFEIIRMLGQGGMGRVYLAIDSKLGRKVAIKVPLFDSDTDRTILERFRREGRAAGAVSHPNVVAIHEIGDTDQGFYIVSEYVEGPTLREYFAQHGKRLSAPTAASLVAAIARGVQAAHLQGVIHRDLKPSNVLLERRPADGSESPARSGEIQIDDDLIRPQVADFGLAGFVDHRTAITMSGALVGTPSYMAPEQVSGVPLGPQADVFSLGVILYELVTGKSPFAGESYVATIDRVQHHDPPLLTKTHSGIPRDLSAICECAINKEPLRRYNTAGELADDLDRYLSGTPVRARSLGPLGRMNRWTRRHPAQAALACVICIALTWSLIQNGRLQTSLNHAGELQQNLSNTARELTDTNAKYRETIYAQDMKQAFDAVNIPAIDDVRPLLARHLPQASETDLRGIEWYALDNEVKTNPGKEFLGHDGEVYDIIVTADKKHFISVGEDRTRRYWDLESGESIRVSERAEIEGSDPLARFHALALSPDGETFFTGGNHLVARKVSDGSLIEQEPVTYHPYNIRAIAVSRDGRYIASLCLQNQIQINSLDRGRPYTKVIPSTPAQRCTRIDFSADGEHLYYVKQEKKQNGGSDFRFVIWDIESEREIESFQLILHYPRKMGPVDLSPDGNLIAIGGDYAVQFYDVASTRFARCVPGSLSFVMDVEFSPNSKLLAAGTNTGFLSITDSGISHSSKVGIRNLYQDRPSVNSINTVAWVDDQRLLTGDSEGRILLHTVRSAILRENTFDAHTCQVDSDGKHVVTIDDQGTGKVIDTLTNEIVYQLDEMRSDPPKHLELAMDAALLAVAYNDQLQIWNLNNQQLSAEVVHAPEDAEEDTRVYKITSVSVSPDGTRIATTGRSDGTVIEWDSKTGRRLNTISLVRNSMGTCAAYSPDGKHLLCAGYRGAFILDLTTGAKTKLTSERVGCAQWISDTQLLVSSGLAMLKIMDIVDPVRNTTFSNQTVQALRSAISPDLKTIVTMQGRWTYFWHVPTARLMGRIDLRAESFAFSPDGNHLYATVKNEDTNRYELRVISKSNN